MQRSDRFSHLPTHGVISRFVAPWDASGWYCVCDDLAKGKRIYTNTDAYIQRIPAACCGGEYIATFDSFAEGFDDKQELDFYVQRDCHVCVALDESADAGFLDGFINTPDVIQCSNGCDYRIYRKAFERDSRVVIPGFSGDCHHLFAFVMSVRELSTHVLDSVACFSSVTERHEARHYQRYYSQLFQQMPVGETPENILCDGRCIVRRYTEAPERKHVAMVGESRMRFAASTQGSDLLTLSLRLPYGKLTVDFCDAAITLCERVGILSNGESLALPDDDAVDLRFYRNARQNQCEIWINSRYTATLPCHGEAATVATLTLEHGHALIDRIALRDQATDFILDESFIRLPTRLAVKDERQVEIAEYPFADVPSLHLARGEAPSASCSLAFPAAQGVVSVETRVRVEDDGFTMLPAVLDSAGRDIVRIAMYRHQLYATNRKKWVKLYGDVTRWMYYPCSNWYHIKVTLDTNAQTYDLFVDGARRCRGFSFIDTVSDVAQAGFFCMGRGMYINALQVYEGAFPGQPLPLQTPVFDVSKPPYNACGDGKAMNTNAIQQAIFDAAYTGGTVLVSGGTFLTGLLQLQSDMTLHVAPDAILLGSQDHQQYPLFEPGESLCASRQLGRGLLYGQNVCNVTLTGGGMIDGNGLYRYKMNDPITNRIAEARPDIIYLAYSNGIHLEKINLRRSCFWSVVTLSCRNVMMDGLNLDCTNTPNRDGIDPVDTIDATIRNCNIMAGDDGLCLKSSDSFGCKRIDVDTMMIQSLASGIKFGTDSYECLEDARFRLCFLKNVNRCGIALEAVDGANVSNVSFRHIVMTDVGAPVYMVVGKRNRKPRGISKTRSSYIDGVSFERITFDQPHPYSYNKSIRESLLIGQDERLAISKVRFLDCSFHLPGGNNCEGHEPQTIDQAYPEYDRHGKSAGAAFTLKNCREVVLENCQLSLKAPDVRPAVACFSCDDVRFEGDV